MPTPDDYLVLIRGARRQCHLFPIETNLEIRKHSSVENSDIPSSEEVKVFQKLVGSAINLLPFICKCNRQMFLQLGARELKNC